MTDSDKWKSILHPCETGLVDNPFYGWSVRSVMRHLREHYHSPANGPCVICGRHQAITHAHHIIPVHRMASMIVAQPRWRGGLEVMYVWLCPNHHAYWHKTQQKQRPSGLGNDVSSAELEQFARLDQETAAAWERFNKTLGLDFVFAEALALFIGGAE